MSKALITLKRISTSTLLLTLATSPILSFAPNKSAVFISAMITAAVGTSALSSFLVHYCSTPYVTTIDKLSDGKIQLNTLTMFGNRLKTIAYPEDFIKSKNRPFSSWMLKPATKIIKSGNLNDLKIGSTLQIADNRAPIQFDRNYYYVHSNLLESTIDPDLIRVRTEIEGKKINPQDWDSKIAALGKI